MSKTPKNNIEEIINETYIKGFKDAQSSTGLDFNHTNKYKKQAKDQVQAECEKYLDEFYIWSRKDTPKLEDAEDYYWDSWYVDTLEIEIETFKKEQRKHE